MGGRSKIVVGLAIVLTVAGAIAGFGHDRGRDLAGRDAECPTAEEATVQAEVTVRVRSDIELDAVHKVLAPKITPGAAPTSGSPGSFESLAACFTGLRDGHLRSFDWHDGRASFTFHTVQPVYASSDDPTIATPDPDSEDERGLFGYVRGVQQMRLTFRRCESSLWAASCAKGAETTSFRVLLPRQVTLLGLRPPATHLQVSEDGRTRTAEWSPAPESVTVDLQVPRPAALTTRFRGAYPPVLTLLHRGDGRIQTQYGTSLGELYALFLVVATFLVVRRTSADAWRRGARTAGVVVLLTFTAYTFGPWFAGPFVDLTPAVAWTAIVLLRPGGVSSRQLAAAVLGAVMAGIGAVVGSIESSGRLLVVSGAETGRVLLCGVGLTIVTCAGLRALQRSYQPVFDLLPGPRRRRLDIQYVVWAAAGIAILYSFAYAIGDAAHARTLDFRPFVERALNEIVNWSHGLEFVVLSTAPWLAVAVLAATIHRMTTSIRWPAALMFAAGVSAPTVWLLDIVRLPVWLLVWLAVGLVISEIASPTAARPPRRQRLDQALRAEAMRSAVAVADRSVDQRTTTMADVRALELATVRTHPGDEARELLAAGPGGTWRANARAGARLGGLIGLVPVIYFTWNAVQALPARLDYATGVLYLLVGVGGELLRWLVAGWCFGALYDRLPGRVGPVKALVLTAAWAAAALAGELISRWATNPSSTNPLLYRTLQLGVVLVVVSVLFDLSTVARSGGSWRRLGDLYRVRTNRDLVVYIGPLAVAVIGLVQQALSGSGLDVAKSFFDTVTAALPGQ
jgi:hypothetical protein